VPQGFVYVLVSPNSNFIKIGGTERPISERLRGINGTASYSEHGPWELSDFLHVTDWRLVEGEIHRHFKKSSMFEMSQERTSYLTSLPMRRGRHCSRPTSPCVSATKRLMNFFLTEASGCSCSNYFSFQGYLAISTFKELGQYLGERISSSTNSNRDACHGSDSHAPAQCGRVSNGGPARFLDGSGPCIG
jgi:hypothetical protein